MKSRAQIAARRRAFQSDLPESQRDHGQNSWESSGGILQPITGSGNVMSWLLLRLAEPRILLCRLVWPAFGISVHVLRNDTVQFWREKKREEIIATVDSV